MEAQPGVGHGVEALGAGSAHAVRRPDDDRRRDPRIGAARDIRQVLPAQHHPVGAGDDERGHGQVVDDLLPRRRRAHAADGDESQIHPGAGLDARAHLAVRPGRVLARLLLEARPRVGGDGLHLANLPEGEPAAKPQPGTDPLSGQNLPSPVVQTATTPQHDMAEPPAENTPAQPAAVAFAAASPSQSATPASALVTAPPTPQLNAQLGSPEWQQALSQQVLMFHRNGQQSAELRLHPQELGALQITLQLDDKQAQLHIASAHGQVRAAVEAAMPQLRHALAESGINLGQSSVGGEATPQWQQQNGTGEGRASYAERHGGGSDATPIEPVSAPAALQRMANQLNGVDIFA